MKKLSARELRQNVLSVKDVKKKSVELKRKQKDSVSSELDVRKKSVRERSKKSAAFVKRQSVLSV